MPADAEVVIARVAIRVFIMNSSLVDFLERQTVCKGQGVKDNAEHSDWHHNKNYYSNTNINPILHNRRMQRIRKSLSWLFHIVSSYCFDGIADNCTHLFDLLPWCHIVPSSHNAVVKKSHRVVMVSVTPVVQICTTLRSPWSLSPTNTSTIGILLSYCDGNLLTKLQTHEKQCTCGKGEHG